MSSYPNDIQFTIYCRTRLFKISIYGNQYTKIKSEAGVESASVKKLQTVTNEHVTVSPLLNYCFTKFCTVFAALSDIFISYWLHNATLRY